LSVAAFDVVGLGVNATDVIAVIDGFPAPDLKLPMHQLEVRGGGVTATALVACARLGLRSRYVGKIGDDLWAEMSLKMIADEGIDVTGVIRAPGVAGHVSLVLVDRDSGKRSLFYRRPAEYTIQPEQLDRGVVTSGRLLHIDAIDPQAALRGVGWAREAGMRISMDGERVVPGVEAVWPRVDLLVCNPIFLAKITGSADPHEGLRVLAAAGPPRVAVTLGEDGVLGLSAGRFVRLPAFKVSAVDTNGAGDAFHGACAIGELNDWPFEWTLTLANAVAAMKCRALGGRAGIPQAPEVAGFLADHREPEIAQALRKVIASQR
jgi:sulfofructose kinase